MTQEFQFDGTIQWLRSIATGMEFPNLVFRGDVDYVTSGLVSLTSIKSQEILTTVHLPSEVYLHDRAHFAKDWVIWGRVSTFDKGILLDTERSFAAESNLET